MFKEWLTTRITFEQIEQENLVKDERLGPGPVLFGFQNHLWMEFQKQIQEGDELWNFSSPAESWRMLCGRAGIALVRNGEIVDSFVTMMN